MIEVDDKECCKMKESDRFSIVYKCHKAQLTDTTQ